MKDYRLLLCIVRRDQYESYLNMFKSIGIEAQFASLCNGTASKSLLDYMGLEKRKRYCCRHLCLHIMQKGY